MELKLKISIEECADALADLPPAQMWGVVARLLVWELPLPAADDFIDKFQANEYLAGALKKRLLQTIAALPPDKKEFFVSQTINTLQSLIA